MLQDCSEISLYCQLAMFTSLYALFILLPRVSWSDDPWFGTRSPNPKTFYWKAEDLRKYAQTRISRLPPLAMEGYLPLGVATLATMRLASKSSFYDVGLITNVVSFLRKVFLGSSLSKTIVHQNHYKWLWPTTQLSYIQYLQYIYVG